MYLKRLRIENFRSFKLARADFAYPGREPADSPPLRERLYPNLNLIIGNNGVGKSATLKAIALALMSPVIQSTGYRPYSIVRRTVHGWTKRAHVRAEVQLCKQDFELQGEAIDHAGTQAELSALVERRRTSEVNVASPEAEDPVWDPMYEETSPAFFFVGYGASRTVENVEHADRAARKRARHVKYERVAGLFEEHTTLMPLAAWLPRLSRENPGRHKQVKNLINKLLPRGTRFLDELSSDGEYLFRHRRIPIPFTAMSDGFRAYLGWICDLLFHLCMGCPSGAKLVDSQGMALIDEVDLHLHPSWQREVLPRMSRALPNIQFICTSHSPIVTGTVESWNLLLVGANGPSASSLVRPEVEVHGLSADQILMSEHFGLASTRAPEFIEDLRSVSAAVTRGEPGSSLKMMRMMSLGTAALDGDTSDRRSRLSRTSRKKERAGKRKRKRD